MVKKTLDKRILPNLEIAATILANFDLWMSRGNVNTFVLVIYFLNEAWVSMMLLWYCLKFMKLPGTPWPYDSNPY